MEVKCCFIMDIFFTYKKKIEKKFFFIFYLIFFIFINILYLGRCKYSFGFLPLILDQHYKYIIIIFIFYFSRK